MATRPALSARPSAAGRAARPTVPQQPLRSHSTAPSPSGITVQRRTVSEREAEKTSTRHVETQRMAERKEQLLQLTSCSTDWLASLHAAPGREERHCLSQEQQ